MAGNPSVVIRRGEWFAVGPSRAPPAPRDGARRTTPETDNKVEGFLTRLYCFYFTSVEWNCAFDLVIVRVLCVKSVGVIRRWIS